MRTIKRGQKYHVDCVVGDRRLRCSLGTHDPKTAGRLRNRIEFAMADGPTSKVWAEIQPILPARTYRQLSSHVGVPKQLAVTWDELVSIFWKDREKGWARSTAKGYSRVARVFGEYLCEAGVFRVKNITKSVISEFQAKAEADGKARGQYRNGAGLHGDIGLLSHIFKFAVDEKLMEANPVRREKSNSVRRVTLPFTPDELGRIRDCMEGPDKLIFMLLRWTGLRASDAVALRASSINWTNHEVIRTNIKNGKEVAIPAHSELMDILPKSGDHNRRVLDGVCDTPGQLYLMCKDLGELSGVENCRPHRFRDTFAVDMLLKGASLLDVAKILGNTAAVVESHYSPFVPALRSKVKQLIENDEKGLEAK